MSIGPGFVRAIDGLSSTVGKVASWLVLAASLISAGNAAIRYAFNISSNGWLEIQWYMFGAMVLLGASQTLAMNEHVRVDLFYSSRSERTQLLIDAVGFALFFIPTISFLLWLSWPFFLQSWRSQEMSSSAGGLILWPAKILLPLGFALLLVQGLAELVKRILALEGRMQVEIKYEKPLQ